MALACAGNGTARPFRPVGVSVAGISDSMIDEQGPQLMYNMNNCYHACAPMAASSPDSYTTCVQKCNIEHSPYRYLGGVYSPPAEDSIGGVPSKTYPSAN
ncbi:hypothetical protein SeLEV6574_g01063 [Synchytrium endobioticum]|nr:hypothetical protein SeLEV6574_g01063 [Synchytrium endobioticum]